MGGGGQFLKMKGRGGGIRERRGGGCTDAGSRSSSVTVRSSTGTRTAAAAEGGADAPVDAASGGFEVMDSERFLPEGSGFSSPAAARAATVTVRLAQPSVYLRPVRNERKIVPVSQMRGSSNALANSSSGSPHFVLQHSMRAGSSGSEAPDTGPSYKPKLASMAASAFTSSSSRSHRCAPALTLLSHGWCHA